MRTKEPGTGEVPGRLRKRGNVVSRFSDSQRDAPHVAGAH